MAHKCQLPAKPTTQQFSVVVLWVFRQHNKMELLCCGRTQNTAQTTVTQKCQRPENAQHNNLKLVLWVFWTSALVGHRKYNQSMNNTMSVIKHNRAETQKHEKNAVSVEPIQRVTITQFRSVSMPAGFRRHLVGKTPRNVCSCDIS